MQVEKLETLSWVMGKLEVFHEMASAIDNALLCMT